ncbi:hypothetical protein LX36DRAFT_649054 [Colletotrichum falcatum]|nr:hypothetical protein LX36DRAFT_649054 [Colletotrichum falcatum]
MQFNGQPVLSSSVITGISSQLLIYYDTKNEPADLTWALDSPPREPYHLPGERQHVY